MPHFSEIFEFGPVQRDAKSCRSRTWAENEYSIYFIAKIAVDAAENEPFEVSLNQWGQNGVRLCTL